MILKIIFLLKNIILADYAKGVKMKYLTKCCLNCKYHIKKFYGHSVIIFCTQLNKEVDKANFCKQYLEE